MQTIQTILIRHYQTVLIVLLIAIISLTFYMGFLEGKRAPSQNVALSCNQNILEKLSIPLATLANPTPAYAATNP